MDMRICFDFDNISISKENKEYNSILDSLKLDNHSSLIIYAGALTQSYDITNIIDGFHSANHKNAKLLILGEGEKKEAYIKYVKKNNIQNIIFHKNVARDVALKIIQKANIAIHAFNNNPHWEYVLGNKLFDYLALGTPVIFCGTGSSADLINESQGGVVVTPSRPDLLSGAIKEMLLLDKKLYAHSKNYIRVNWKRSIKVKEFIKKLETFLNKK